MDSREVGEIALEWSAALHRSDAAPTSVPPDIHRLTGWIVELEAALSSRPFDPSPAARIGAEMVRSNLVDPAALTPAATAVAGLLERSRLPDRTRRFGVLLGELGRGYSAELLKADAERREGTDQRFRVVFEHAAVAIALYDSNGVTLEANPTTARMVGIDQKDLPGVSGLDLMHPEDRDKLRDVVVDLYRRRSGTVHFEGRFVRPDGTVCWGAWTMTLVRGAGGRDLRLLAVGQDITERRAMERKLWWQARHDPLTGLANRHCLLEQLEAIIATARPADHIGLCFLDLDEFKMINDRYGHRAGDSVLAEVGRRLDAAMTSPTVTVGRIGGDEFVALLAPPCSEAIADAAARTMLATLREPVPVGPDAAMSLSASIGAVVAPVAGANAEKLLDDADLGLYRAKAAGRGTWVLHRDADGPAEPSTGAP
ncbi:sensor domain-containing diguanylate cyclase [Nocardia veterana]|uniref:Diguanylate cyclase n=1 Tax=Nocardia veterana TaxID=132249 RepID=A0A7X6RFY1_9NOCA|nr:sensor domain-containing diguanylate cyclase [Nocardia veterana]NKY84053.1 diguanylate cyclase [Nocardia veterana]